MVKDLLDIVKEATEEVRIGGPAGVQRGSKLSSLLCDICVTLWVTVACLLCDTLRNLVSLLINDYLSMMER